MKTQEFCYWLQGYLEIRDNKDQGITAKQLAVIENHLALVFKHDIDPQASGGDQGLVDALQKIHDGQPSGEIKYRC